MLPIPLLKGKDSHDSDPRHAHLPVAVRGKRRQELPPGHSPACHPSHLTCADVPDLRSSELAIWALAQGAAEQHVVVRPDGAGWGFQSPLSIAFL